MADHDGRTLTSTLGCVGTLLLLIGAPFLLLERLSRGAGAIELLIPALLGAVGVWRFLTWRKTRG